MGQTKDRLRRGEPALGGWMMVGHPTVVELLAGAGFDRLCVDRKPTLTLLIALLLASFTPLPAAEFFVSPSGNDTNPGTEAKPFATLERGRDAARHHGEGDARPRRAPLGAGPLW